jgi:hypothetical protein
MVGGAPPVWVVFDLNGTLTALSNVRHRIKDVLIRPHIAGLRRLKELVSQRAGGRGGGSGRGREAEGEGRTDRHRERVRERVVVVGQSR